MTGLGTVLDEVQRVLSVVQLDAARELLDDRARRWFCAGQGRSGLVAQMVAMRLMHLGFDAHAVGEATAPALGDGDGLLAVSGSGETPMTLHVAGLARGFGARVLAVTTRGDSSLARLADAVVEIPTTGTVQFGGSLFEQCALLALDALAVDLGGDHVEMAARHTNLQ
jgi:6-phospho-3-hexuloisomerase